MNYEAFLQRVCPPLDLQWRKYWRRSVRRRLEARLAELGLPSWEAYLALLAADPAERDLLPERMRVTLSRFFRERERWELLEHVVVPGLIEAIGPRGTLRVWSAGACNGEEPYTLALLWKGGVARRYPGWDLQILATDIDPQVIRRGAIGRYPERTLREAPGSCVTQWFEREGKEWALSAAVKSVVEWRRHDLTRDPLPHGLDLVLCRYLVFTYFTGDRRERAARRLWDSLRPGGALMIGRKEGLSPRELAFFSPWESVPGTFRRAASEGTPA